MYRQSKPLADLIAPDRRKQKLFITIALSVLGGIALCMAGSAVMAHYQTSQPQPHLPIMLGRIQPAVLSGADHDIAMPPPGLAIMNVWMQGCQDCMPAFEAMARLQDEGGLGVDVPIYNIAYGEAEPSWAKRYGVRENLAYDLGGASVVRPLGINTFTTIVIDKDGTILLRDRPDQAGYRARVRAAVHADDHVDKHDPLAKETLGADAIDRVVESQRTALKRNCWDTAKPTTTRASVTIRAIVGADGRVSSTSSMTNDPGGREIGACVEGEVRKWRFPPGETGPGGRGDVTVNIPFKFVRQ